MSTSTHFIHFLQTSSFISRLLPCQNVVSAYKHSGRITACCNVCASSMICKKVAAILVDSNGECCSKMFGDEMITRESVVIIFNIRQMGFDL